MLVVRMRTHIKMPLVLLEELLWLRGVHDREHFFGQARAYAAVRDPDVGGYVRQHFVDEGDTLRVQYDGPCFRHSEHAETEKHIFFSDVYLKRNPGVFF